MSMSTRLTLNPGQRPIKLDRPVATIEVATGRVFVNGLELLGTGDTYQAGGKAGLSISSPDGANIGVTYAEEAPR